VKEAFVRQPHQSGRASHGSYCDLQARKGGILPDYDLIAQGEGREGVVFRLNRLRRIRVHR
jgi:hypothetical protein